MAHTFHSLVYHVVFSTRDREPYLAGKVRPRVHAYLGGLVSRLEGRVMRVGGVADHVHLLVGLPARMAVADLVRDVKANSTCWIQAEIEGLRGFGWQTGYGAFSVSQSVAAWVERYIANQEEHHRRIGFRDEFVSLLKRHNLRWDNPYLWE